MNAFNTVLRIHYLFDNKIQSHILCFENFQTNIKKCSLMATISKQMIAPFKNVYAIYITVQYYTSMKNLKKLFTSVPSYMFLSVKKHTD